VNVVRVTIVTHVNTCRRSSSIAVDELRALVRGAQVRKHGDADSVRAGDLSDAVDALEEHRPGTVRNLRGSRVAGLGERRGEHDELGSTRGQPSRLARHRAELLRAARALVQPRSAETTDAPKP